MKYIDTYNGKSFEHKITITHHNDFDYYSIQAFDAQGKEMGFLNFSVQEESLWLYKLETHEQYRNRGVASTLLNMLEYMAKYKWKNSIEGKFYPDNEFAKPLYEKFGYTIDNEWTGQTLFKYVYFDKVKNEKAPKIIDFEIKESFKKDEEKEM